MSLFTEQINNWKDWRKVLPAITTFAPLIEHIFQKENLPATKIETVKSGMMSAVFKVGDCVVKIFAPSELDEDFVTHSDVELFGMKLANSRGVPAPKLIAYDAVEDKYHFRYMIMEYVNGKRLFDIEEDLSYEDKVIIGQNMRKITDKLNVPCEKFTPVDIIQCAMDSGEWGQEGFPESFQAERLEYITNMRISENERVYCHGDLHGHNILADDRLNLYIIDFAEAVYVPNGYEQAYIASCLFAFERPYMMGYFGDYNVEEIVNLCMTWLPVHSNGHGTMAGNFNTVSEITSFDVMHERLYNLIEREKQKPCPMIDAPNNHFLDNM